MRCSSGPGFLVDRQWEEVLMGKYYSYRTVDKEIMITDFDLSKNTIAVGVLQHPSMTIRDATPEEELTIFKAMAVAWLARHYGWQ